MFKKKSELEKEYFDELHAWEANATLDLRKSEKRAWVIAGMSALIAVMAVGAVLGLTPLKSVDPFVVRVDQSTGVVDIVKGLQDGKTSYDEAINKYFLAMYVRAREGYMPSTRDYDRRVVGLMSNSAVSQQYAELTDPKRNPQAPIALYGDVANVLVNVTNISFVSQNTALVRYTKRIERAGQRSATQFWMATIPFTYVKGKMSEANRLINPLGFQVTNYRTDPETVGG